ncbi:MAG: molybdenum cofactor guanylyltransferase [Theionarchaea archaeon]|nr:molybdenum cofactor guanylyltransferase [Theionarchaea archaeon]
MKAALILAGGKARRFNGERKAYLPLGGKPLLQWVIDALEPCVDEIIISGEKDLEKFGYPVIEDHMPNIGPLAGFHAGFPLLSSPYTFVTGCDTPFITSEVISLLFEFGVGYSCCVPQDSSYLEPLCCVYNTRETFECCAGILESEKTRIWDLICCLPNPRFIPYSELRRVDPSLLCLRNINSPPDLDLAKHIIEEIFP